MSYTLNSPSYAFVEVDIVNVLDKQLWKTHSPEALDSDLAGEEVKLEVFSFCSLNSTPALLTAHFLSDRCLLLMQSQSRGCSFYVPERSWVCAILALAAVLLLCQLILYSLHTVQLFNCRTHFESYFGLLPSKFSTRLFTFHIVYFTQLCTILVR